MESIMSAWDNRYYRWSKFSFISWSSLRNEQLGMTEIQIIQQTRW